MKKLRNYYIDFAKLVFITAICALFVVWVAGEAGSANKNFCIKNQERLNDKEYSRCEKYILENYNMERGYET